MSRLSDWRSGGPAEPRRIALSLAADTGIAALLTILAWPFPFVRQSVAWPAHIGLIVVAVLITGGLYRVACIRAWGRTPAMYLMDLGLEPRSPGLARSAAWALLVSVLSLPALAAPSLTAGDGLLGRIGLHVVRAPR